MGGCARSAAARRNARIALRVYWCAEGFDLQLSTQESTLLEAFRRLPPNAADEFSALARRLAALSTSTRIDWSDSWSDEDLREFTAHSLKRFDEEEESR